MRCSFPQSKEHLAWDKMHGGAMQNSRPEPRHNNPSGVICLRFGATLLQHQQGDEERSQRQRKHNKPVMHKAYQQERGKGHSRHGEHIRQLG